MSFAEKKYCVNYFVSLSKVFKAYKVFPLFYAGNGIGKCGQARSLLSAVELRSALRRKDVHVATTPCLHCPSQSSSSPSQVVWGCIIEGASVPKMGATYFMGGFYAK